MNLRITPRFCLILIAVMLLVFGVSFGVSLRDLRAGQEKLSQVQAEHAEMLAEVQRLREELAFAETDEYVERVARDELSLIKPGEIRYMTAK